jgi:U3 small nucleolar RNA-associated protein 11
MTFHCSMQKIEKLTAVLHSLDNQPSNKHVYYAEDRFELPNFKFIL